MKKMLLLFALALGLSTTSYAQAPEIDLQNITRDELINGGFYSYDFVPSTTTLVRTFRILNSGDGPLQVSNIQLSVANQSSYTLQSLPVFPATIDAGNDLYFDVKFAPTSIGNKIDTLIITNNDSDEGTYKIALRGIGTAAPAPFFYVSADNFSGLNNGGSVTFPAQVKNTSTDYTFYIGNDGNASMNVTGITITGTDQSQFSLSGTPSYPKNVLNGGYFSYTVTFAPTSAGNKTAILNVTSDDPANGTYALILHATSVATGAPEINVTGYNEQPLLNGNSATLYNAAVGSNNNQSYFTILNSGTADLSISAITITGADASEFTLDDNGLPGNSLQASSSNEISINFHPSSTGVKTALLTITSNDADEGTYTILLNATGINPSPEIDAYAVNFNGLPKGSTFTLASTIINETGDDYYIGIQNTGTADLTISAISLTGTNASEFSMETLTFPLTVQAFNNVDFRISFVPTSEGTKTATITIKSDDSDEGTYTIILKATATATAVPGIQIYAQSFGGLISSGGSYAFANIVNNTLGYQEYFKLFNSGTGNLTVSNATITGTNASEFILLDLNAQDEWDPNYEREFEIIFAPTSLGSKTATLTITTDDPEQEIYTINLMATSIAAYTPEIEVSINDAEEVINSGGSLTLASVLNGTSGNAKSVEIENLGWGDLTVSNITLTGANASEFILDPSLSFPFVVSSFNDLWFNVTFTPSSVGTKTATLIITSNDTDEGVYTITLNAVSVNTAASKISIRSPHEIANNGTLTLPDMVPEATSITQTITLENLGSSDLHISSITLTGADTTEFVLDNEISLPTYLISGDYNDNLYITFAPTSLGTKTVALKIISDDAAASSYVINISANATTTSISSAHSFIGSSKVYPNPTSDMATLELSLVSESSVRVILSDLMGKEVMTVAEGNYSSLNSQFSVSALSRGIYTITYFVNGGAAKSELLMVR